MKKLHILPIALAALVLTGCEQERIAPHHGHCIKLNVFASDIELTRASDSKNGETDLNENLINTLDYFVYSGSDVTNGNAYIKGRYTMNVNSRGNIEIDLSDNEWKALFPNDGDKCKIFIIANLPNTIGIPQNTSMDNLKAIALTAGFTTQDIQTSFVMAKDSEIIRSGTSATGSLQLDRIASKLSIEVSVIDKFVEDRGNTDPSDDITWTPKFADMKIELKNVAEHGNVGGSAATIGELKNYGKRSFQAIKDGDGNPAKYTTTGVGTFYKYCVKDELPWYSYPRDWSASTTSGTTKPEPISFLVTLPWSKPISGGGTQVQKSFYKILLNEEQLIPDKWYHIIAELRVLGSFYEDDPTLVLPNDLKYYAIDWKKGIPDGYFNTDAYIKDARYLTVPQRSYILDNVNSISIPYSSSHECVAEVLKAEYTKYSGSIISTGDFYEYGDSRINDDNPGGWTISTTGTNVVLSYTLKNDITVSPLKQGTFDFVEYRYTISLHHSDPAFADEYNEIIEVKQRPQLVLTAEENTADKTGNLSTTFVNSEKDTENTTDKDSDNHKRSWYCIKGRRTSGANSSPYMYIVTASKTDDYMIGDPRWTDYKSGVQIGMTGTATDGLGYGTFPKPASATAPAIYIATDQYFNNPNNDNKRQLLYYYGTNSDDAHKNMVAPSFRISSANGFHNSNYCNEEQIIWRCATYQEYGYPAGRWRLPTYAELRFMATLSGAGLINSMFANGSKYWAADGVYVYNSGDGSFNKSSGTGLSRCVYDEWYWSQSNYATLPESLRTQFTWGDMPRDKFK